ncbi:MAG: homoserine kinase [Cyanobacteria bacterium P01_H01_bin.74]
MTKYCYKIPATIANVGPGFDTFGVAIQLYNTFKLLPVENSRVSSERDLDTLTATTDCRFPAAFQSIKKSHLKKNILFQSINAVFKAAGKLPRPFFNVEVAVDIPVMRGLGSSSSAVAAGLMAANDYLGCTFDSETLIQLGTKIEGHPDNITPALTGGFVLCDVETHYPLLWPEAWQVTVISPSYAVATAQARQALPESYPKADAISTVKKASLLIHAIHAKKSTAFKNALEDQLHQPYRQALIPEFLPLKQHLSNGSPAFGTIISGSGSTLAVFHHKDHQKDLVENWILPFFNKAPFNTGNPVILSTAIDNAGALRLFS